MNPAFLSFNKGLLSPKALARVDLERTRLSAEVFTNFICKTQGALTIRPGTKYMGSSLSDTGAEFIEFIAATDDVALVELTHNKMRLWIGSDAHSLALLGRPGGVNTTVTLSDTGWSNTSTGGNFGGATATDLIPTMTAATTNGVEVTADAATLPAWHAADDDITTGWQKNAGVPGWLNVDFGASNAKAVGSYSLRAGHASGQLNNQPAAWRLIGSNYDTGTYATDTGKWSLEDERSSQTGWSVSEQRTYAITDTGIPGPWRHWRLYVITLNGDTEIYLPELELLRDTGSASVSQAQFSSGTLTLNATSIGALARTEKRVIISDTGTEHSLAIDVGRGPVVLRVGSTQRDDDYIAETQIGTGYHNLAFTPDGDFWITLQHDGLIDRIVRSLTIGDSGTVELTAPWDAADLANVRYDQSADVVYVDCDGVRPSKIERRGTGRSWSVVDYAPDNGPFLPSPSSSAKMSVSHFFGNTTLNSDIPFFTADHVGALIRAFHEGQSGQFRLGAAGAKTDAIEVTGIGDTGTPGSNNERRITFSASGTYAGRLVIKRSFDGKDRGFKPISSNLGGNTLTASDTGTFTKTIDDPDDNVKVWYRAELADTGSTLDTGAPQGYFSGVAVVDVTYPGGGVTGIGRITGYSANDEVSIEVLSRFSDTGATDNWQQGYWSEARGFPAAVALHGGRLAHAQKGSLFLSVSDDYENFDATTVGDAGPIVKTLGSGPVDAIKFLSGLTRLVIGTAGAELSARASDLNEALTPDNTNASTPFSTRGAASLRALKLDTSGLYLSRSGQRVMLAGPEVQQATLGEKRPFDLTLLVPDLLAAGAVSIAIQREPDTRLLICLADGTGAVLTYEPDEEVICWSTWTTDGLLEKVAVLPGVSEDAVFYHVRRTINGVTKRYLEKWAKESECVGDTGLSYLADCSASFTDTGRTSTLTGFSHLAGASVVVWSDDTGSIPGVDRSPDVNGVQTTYTVDTGAGTVSLSVPVHHAVAGLPFESTWISTKLAYAAELGTALAQQKRAPQLGLVLYQTHASGLFYGTDTGRLDPLPRVIDGAVVDADEIHETLDMVAVALPDKWHPDTRLVLRAKAPRPATVLAAVPTVVTSER